MRQNIKKVLKRLPLFSQLARIALKHFPFFYQSEMKIPTMPYVFSKSDAQRVYNVVLSGKIHHTQGQEMKLLENEFAAYHKTKYSLTVNSGTSALELALKAIGLMPGEEVIVPAYTFIATAQAVLSQGGIPVFADIDDTFTLNPNSVEKVLSKKTKAIIVVHMFGNVANMDRIMNIANKYHLRVIEDCCQAVGARYKSVAVGTIGDVGCFSFTIQKAITSGQGGMLVTASNKMYEIANRTRDTGQFEIFKSNDINTIQHTYMLTEMQATLARSILSQLESLNDRRRHNYQLFTQLMDTTSIPLRWYRVLPNTDPAFSRLALLIDFQKLRISRDKFLYNIREKGIPLKTYYPTPLYRYSLFRYKKDILTQNTYPFHLNKISYSYKLPYTETFCQQHVGMEFSPYLSQQHIEHIAHTFRQLILSYL